MNTKKSRLKNKGLRYAFGAIVFVIAIMFALSCIAKKKYWESAHLQNLKIDMSRYTGYLSVNNIHQDEIQDIVHKCNKEAVPVPDECSDYFYQWNQLISKYFQEVYSVDVSDALNSLTVKKAFYPEEIAETVGGAFSSELGSLFINASLLDSFMADTAGGTRSLVSDHETFSFKMLRAIYIHETIHSLGFADDAQINRFMEAITESLTEKVMVFNGIEYENVTGYGEIKELAAQVIAADPGMIRATLQDKSYKIGKHMEQVMGGGRVEELDDLIFIQQRGEARSTKKSRILPNTWYTNM